MSSEQDEQMIQEIVGQVMAASIEGNIEVELSTPDKSADSIEEVKVTIPIGTKTEGSGSMIQEHMGLPEMNDGFITGQNGGIHSTDITISGVEEKIPPAEFNLSSIRSPDRLDALLDLSEVSQPTNEQSESANVTNTEEVMLPKHLERKLETDGDEEDKENVDTAINIESIVENFGSDVDKVFEPITPPVLGTTNAQEQHSLEQHEQQQQLFNVSAAIAVGSDTYVVNVPESGEESGDPSMNTDALKANGKEVGGAKIEVSTSGHQTKAEHKPKTKLCTII